MSSTSPNAVRKWTIPDVILTLARWGLGLSLLWYSVPKISEDPVEFLKLIHEYHLVPASGYLLLNVVAVVLPWVELFAGIALILGFGVRGTAAVVLVLMVAFTGAIVLRAWSIMSSENIPFLELKFDCGCGTGIQIIWQKLLTNSGLILLSILVLCTRTHRACLWEKGTRAFSQSHSPSEPKTGSDEVSAAD